MPIKVVWVDSFKEGYTCNSPLVRIILSDGCDGLAMTISDLTIERRDG